jgi:hypothetical protein
MTQPLQPEWRSSDPLCDLVDRKSADIVILRPSIKGGHYDAGMGYCEMKHGWHVHAFFGEESLLITT